MACWSAAWSRLGEQVLGEGAVVEPVDGPVGDGAAFDDERAGVAGQPEQVLVGVAVARGQGVGQQRPDVFPGQATALGVGQREQQVDRRAAWSPRRRSRSRRMAGPARLGRLARHAGSRGIGNGGLGGLGGGQDPGDEKRVPGRLGDRRGHGVQQRRRARGERRAGARAACGRGGAGQGAADDLGQGGQGSA